jgi:anti-sigma B factor antagonist
MQINQIKEGNTVILQLEGDLDASSAIYLDEELEKVITMPVQRILIDFKDLHYISSTGLGVFVSYMDRLRDRQIQMVLYGMSSKVKNVFAILGIDKLLTIVENKEAALHQA